jgi:3-deoxy-7-phosphoheptulonate synthase
MRALGECGFSEITSVRRWGLSGEQKASALMEEISEKLDETVALLTNWGSNGSLSAFLAKNPVFTSHEALLLPYESAMSRFSDEYDSYFNLGAHFLWLGERTKHLDGAHVEYLRGIENPVGIKVGPTTQPEELCKLIRILNPNNEWGKICVITRLGYQRVREILPELISSIKSNSLNVTWSCDPMHGNIVRMSDGIKTRYFDSIKAEVIQSQKIHQDLGSWLGGVHLEITAEDVTECVGGEVGVSESQLGLNYQSYCDPRLNYSQSLELMNQICDEHKRSHQREVAGAAQGSPLYSEGSTHRIHL